LIYFVAFGSDIPRAAVGYFMFLSETFHHFYKDNGRDSEKYGTVSATDIQYVVKVGLCAFRVQGEVSIRTFDSK
jgi:hypothetical protein